MKNFLYAIISIFLFSSCSSMKITSNYDPNADFSNFQTFTFLPWSKQMGEILTSYDKSRVRAAATQELEKLGYKKTDGKADLAVSILIIVDEKTATATYNDYYTSGPAVGYYYGPWGANYAGGVSSYTTMHSYDYKEGTMIVDLLDVKKKKRTWHGIAKKTLNSRKTGDGSVIKKAMANLFKDFPLEKK